MSCEACYQAQINIEIDGGYPYRWRNALVVLVGCREHVKEIMDTLNRVEHIANDR